MEEAKPAAPPPAQPFAVMRMTHEAIRVGLKEVETAAKQLTMVRNHQAHHPPARLCYLQA